AQPCQGWGREFESRFPLQSKSGKSLGRDLEHQSYRISFPAPVEHDVIDEIAVRHRLTDTIIVPRYRRFFCA
ncbi:MAG: hypothetical protein ACTH7C_11645, partial [Cobetia marina]